MRQAKEIVFQNVDEQWQVEHFDMAEVEKICIGTATNLAASAYIAENGISAQEQVAVLFLKGKPNRCFRLKEWDVSFLYDSSDV